MNVGVLFSASVANVLYPLLFSLCTVVAVAVFVWLMVRFMGKTDKVPVAAVGDESAAPAKTLDYKALLCIFLLIGLILRLIFVFAVKGYRSDMKVITALFEHLDKNGFGANYYVSVTQGTVLPLTYYIYAFMGMFANLFGLTADAVFTPLFVKLPLIVADSVTAFVLFRLAKTYLNSAAAVIVAAFVCVCPIFVFASGVWGTTYSLLSMFLVLTVYFVVRKNFIGTVGCYTAALLCHKDAVYLFPLIAVFVIYNLVKACMTVHAKKASFSEAMRDPAMRPVFTICVSIVGFALAAYLITLPVYIGSYGAGFFTYIYRLYLQPLGTFTLFGHNSLGIFNLFMRNGKALNSRFPSVVFAVLFGVIITGIVLLVYLSKKNRANLVFLSAYILLTLATYFVGFNEFGLLGALFLLLTAFLLIRDKRILLLFGVLSLAVTVNATAVMASAEYFNNNVAYYFSAPGYAGSELLRGGAVAVTIVCSVLAVLAHLYATMVLLDISMSNKRKVLPYAENATFGKAMALLFSPKSK